MNGPWWRVASLADVAPEKLEQFVVEFEAYVALLPCAKLIKTVEISGSFPSERALLHSDLDVSLSFGDDLEKALAMNARHPDQVQKASDRLMQLQRTCVLWHVDVAFRRESEQSLGFKQGYNIRTKEWFGMDQPKVDYRIRPDTKAYVVRQRKVGRIGGVAALPPDDPDHAWMDEDEYLATRFRGKHDQEWAQRYGAKFLRKGQTADSKGLR